MTGPWATLKTKRKMYIYKHTCIYSSKQNYKNKQTNKKSLHKTLLHIVSFIGFKCRGWGLLHRHQFSHHTFLLSMLMLHLMLIKCTCVNNVSVRESKALLIPLSPQKRIRKEIASLHGGQRIE